MGHALSEFGCRDGTPYPVAWREDRLPVVQRLLARVEELFGPVTILSAYRTPEYNASLDGAKQSQHMAGRALDIKSKIIPAADLHALILRAYNNGMLPELRGLGAYNGFVHIDTRPTAKLVRWGNQAKSLPEQESDSDENTTEAFFYLGVLAATVGLSLWRLSPWWPRRRG